MVECRELRSSHLVRLEFVDALQVVVATDNVVALVKASEEVAGELKTLGGAGEERAAASAVLGLAKVTERDNKLGGVGLGEDLLEVVTALERVVEVARVQLRGTISKIRILQPERQAYERERGDLSEQVRPASGIF